MGMPVVTGMRIAADKCLYMEDRADSASFYDLLDALMAVPCSKPIAP